MRQFLTGMGARLRQSVLKGHLNATSAVPLQEVNGLQAFFRALNTDPDLAFYGWVCFGDLKHDGAYDQCYL